MSPAPFRTMLEEFSDFYLKRDVYLKRSLFDLQQCIVLTNRGKTVFFRGPQVGTYLKGLASTGVRVRRSEIRNKHFVWPTAGAARAGFAPGKPEARPTRGHLVRIHWKLPSSDRARARLHSGWQHRLDDSDLVQPRPGPGAPPGPMNLNGGRFRSLTPSRSLRS